MKLILIIVAIGLILVHGEIANDYELSRNENLTDNSHIRELPEPPLIEILKDEDLSVHHWFPWTKPKQLNTPVENEEIECREESSKDEFPDDLFTQEQRLQGAIVLHFIGVIYFFTVSGIMINNYFIPSVQCICEDLKITPDVGGAVFMATATATPELFTNLISTFIADSDMGLGAIIGSLMFNILGVAALASLATSKPVQMDWVPITRDCIMFSINIIVLIGTSWDGYIQWYEALIVMLFAIPYYVVMFQSARISRFMKRKFEDEYHCCNRNNYDLEKDLKGKQANTVYTKNGLAPIQTVSVIGNKPQIEEEKLDQKTIAERERKQAEIDKQLAEEKEAYALLKVQRLGLWPCPKDSVARTIFWYYSWPIRVVLFCTLPNPKTQRRWYPLTFVVCVAWIGVVTYLIFFMLIIISYTFGIRESIMGITVFAIGGCTPEMITGFIMARRGESGVGVANSVGASSLAIIIALGIPWFFRAVISTYGHEKTYVNLHSNGMEYIILSMLLLILIFYLVVFFSRFTLRKITGGLLFLTYAIFVTFAVLMELGIFFDVICIPY